MFEELELVDVCSSNGTDMLHTWLLAQLHPGGQWANRSLAGKLYRQVPSILCESHICLRVSPPIALVRLPGKCTSISRHLVTFCTECYPQTDTYLTDGLLSLLLLAHREALLFEGNGLSVDPMARRQGLKASLRLREHSLLLQEPGVLR